MFQCAQTRENSLFGPEENVLNYVTLNFLFDNSNLYLGPSTLGCPRQSKRIKSPQEYFLYALEVYRLFHCGLEFSPPPI
jgi:hypothetical protein